MLSLDAPIIEFAKGLRTCSHLEVRLFWNDD